MNMDYLIFRDGKIVTLKEEDSDTETQKPYRYRSNPLKNNKRFKPRKNVPAVNDFNEEGEKQCTIKGRSKKRTLGNIKSGTDNNLVANEVEVRLLK